MFIKPVIATILFVTVVFGAQQSDSSKAAVPQQTIEVSSKQNDKLALKKYQTIAPKPTSNWSKIKELFL